MVLNLMSHGILHSLWSADLSKSFSQLIVSIFTFLNQYFLPIFIFFSIIFTIDFARRKSVGLPHIAYIIDSLTLSLTNLL